MLNLCFCIQWDPAAHVVHSCVSGARNVDALFFMLGSARRGFHKERTGIHYAELVFLHLVGYASHIVYSSVSGHKKSMHYFSRSGGPGAIWIKSTPRHVTLNLCFCIWWELRVTLCIPVHPRHESSMHYFSCSSGPSAVFIKSASGHVTPNLRFYNYWDPGVT
jgi:hypothetical protein